MEQSQRLRDEPNLNENEEIDGSVSVGYRIVAYSFTASHCSECCFMEFTNSGVICARLRGMHHNLMHRAHYNHDDQRPSVGPDQEPPAWCPLREDNIKDNGQYGFAPFDSDDDSE